MKDNKKEENGRPKLSDPEEYALIKAIHFKDNRPKDEDLDPFERIERMEAKHRNRHKNSR